LALSLVASAPLAQAQPKKGGMSPEQQLERIEQAVGSLSGEQKSKIKDVIAQSAEELRNVPKEERREKMGELMRARNAKIRALLTPEQQKKFDEMPQGRGPGGGGGGRKKKSDN